MTLIDRTDMMWRGSANLLSYCNYHPINHPPCGSEPIWSARPKASDPDLTPMRGQSFGVCDEHEQRYRNNGSFDLEPLAVSPTQAAL
jgi:hypothetical protein